jgi:hypothetical protein
VFSSFVAMRAVLHDLPVLFKHSEAVSEQSDPRTSKEKIKFKGLAKKLQSWFLISEICIMKDGLHCLKQLSLYLQKNDSNVIFVMDHIENCQEKLLALKQENGKT